MRLFRRDKGQTETSKENKEAVSRPSEIAEMSPEGKVVPEDAHTAEPVLEGETSPESADAPENETAKERLERRKYKENLAEQIMDHVRSGLLVRMPFAAIVRARLRDKRSILVRDFSSAPGLEDCLRITVGTPHENDELLDAIASVLKEVV